MHKIIFRMGILTTILGLLNCSNKNSESKNRDIEIVSTSKGVIDIERRNELVKKYDLMNFPKTENVIMTLDEFFIGNNDEASIAPNLETKLPVKKYFENLKSLEKNQKTIAVLTEIKDVMIYDNNKLNDNEWFYTDIIYIIGDLTKEEVKQATLELQPDEVEYDVENKIEKLKPEYSNKRIVYLWWD